MYVYYPEGCVAKYNEFIDIVEGHKKPETSYVYSGTTSLYPGMAPVGKQLVYACMSCLGDPDIDLDPYLDYVKNRVMKIMPEIFNHIERTEVFGPANVPGVGTDIVLPHQGGEAYGLALSVGQAGGSGLETHQAVDSGINVSKLILAHLEKERKK